jgi:hypothetical protein
MFKSDYIKPRNFSSWLYTISRAFVSLPSYVNGEKTRQFSYKAIDVKKTCPSILIRTIEMKGDFLNVESVQTISFLHLNQFDIALHKLVKESFGDCYIAECGLSGTALDNDFNAKFFQIMESESEIKKFIQAEEFVEFMFLHGYHTVTIATDKQPLFHCRKRIL